MAKTITLPVRELAAHERDYLKSFQELLSTLMQYFKPSKNKNPYFQGDPDEFFDAMKKFHNYPFAFAAVKVVNKMKAAIQEHGQAKENLPQEYTIIEKGRQLEQMFLNNNINLKTMSQLADVINKQIKDYSIGSQDKSAYIKSINFRNPMFIENPLFFQTTSFIRYFEIEEMNEIINMDVDNEYKYTFLDFPYNDVNYQYVVFFIQNLQTDDKPVSIDNARRLDKIIKYKHRDNAEFAELLSNVDRYLSSNNRELLPKIISQMKDFPDLVQANNQSKKDMILYRGAPFNGDTGEKPRGDQGKYTSGSLDKNVALNFALSIGHLEAKSNARTDGIIYAYQVPAQAVILNTEIFGGIFGEREIIFDATKSKLVDEHMVTADEYRHEDDYDPWN